MSLRTNSRMALAAIAVAAMSGAVVLSAATPGATVGTAGAAGAAKTARPHAATSKFSKAAVALSRIADPARRGKAIAHLVPDLPDVTSAYHVKDLWDKGTNGAGVTIAIIVSFGDANIQQVIDQYDQENGLPAADVQTITPAGPLPPCETQTNCSLWGSETDLDVTMIHSMAPGAKIVIAATPVDETVGMTGFPEMMKAIDYLVSNKTAAAISMSLTAGEETFDSFDQIKTLDPTLERAAKAGVPIMAGSGDDGATQRKDTQGTDFNFPAVGWPASDPLVTAVGGTVLHLDGSGNRTTPDTLWPQSGGGFSKAYKRPAWQDDVKDITKSDFRAVPEITMDGVQGTSQATPLFAGVVALATQANHGRPLGFLNPAIHALGAKGGDNGIVDVTEGDNSYNGVQGFAAAPGYDVVSGWGTVDAPAFVAALVAQANKAR